MNARQRQQLAAMGIRQWVPRPGGPLADEVPMGIAVDPSAGDAPVLMLTGLPDPGDAVLFEDFRRAVGPSVCRGWPEANEPVLAERVSGGLLTHIIVFGQGVAAEVFGADAPERVGSARLIVLPSLKRLAAESDARREAWAALVSAGGLVAS